VGLLVPPNEYGNRRPRRWRTPPAGVLNDRLGRRLMRTRGADSIKPASAPGSVLRAEEKICRRPWHRPMTAMARKALRPKLAGQRPSRLNASSLVVDSRRSTFPAIFSLHES